MLLGLGGSLGFIHFIKESPRYYAANCCMFSKTRKVLQIIANANNTEMVEDLLRGEELNEYNGTGN